MNAARAIGFLLAVPLLMCSTPVDALACRCVPDVPLCETYWSSDAVFEGTVTRVERLRATDRSDFLASVRVTFAVNRVWRGATKGAVAVVTGSGGGDCGYRFREGRKYLVYAAEAQGRLVTNICAPTKPLERAAADLAYLAEAPAAGDEGRIYGVVRSSDGRPAPRYIVVLRTDDGQMQSTTNAAGEYAFSGRGAGSYAVRVVPRGGERAYGREEVTLPDPRACARRDFTIERERAPGGAPLR